MKYILFLVLLVIAFSAPDPNFYIFLAFGQSNMDGASTIENQDQQCPERFKMFAAVDMPTKNRKKYNWYTANPPLCREGSQMSPCDYFGRELVSKLPEEIKVGIINVAVAGCSIDLFIEDRCEKYLSTAEGWLKNFAAFYGGNPFRSLVKAAKEAQKDGVIKGILMHQGETNTADPNWPKNVKIVYDNLLMELGLNGSDVPLLVGEVVDSAMGGKCGAHNNVVATVPNVIPNSHVIQSDGLKHKGDGLHFDSAAMREFGKRYAEKMLTLLK